MGLWVEVCQNTIGIWGMGDKTAPPAYVTLANRFFLRKLGSHFVPAQMSPQWKGMSYSNHILLVTSGN